MQKENGYTLTTLSLRDDYEGPVTATLIEKSAGRETDKAVLYIHGFVDYFFQHEMADRFNAMGYDFFAIELRKYGRSILPHQKPNNFRKYTEYFEELDKATELIRQKHSRLVLLGHSTGGLIGALYAHHRREQHLFRAVVLNSPFFDFNAPALLKKTVLPLVAALGKRFPDLPSPEGLKKGYAESLHKDFYGEWDFDLRYKPIEGFPVTLGWIHAIFAAQHELQRGLDIPVPVLVMHAEKSVKPGNYTPAMHTADAVLSVKDIARLAPVVGKQVETAVFTDGIHDLVLSKKEVREKVYRVMEDFLKKHGL